MDFRIFLKSSAILVNSVQFSSKPKHQHICISVWLKSYQKLNGISSEPNKFGLILDRPQENPTYSTHHKKTSTPSSTTSPTWLQAKCKLYFESYFDSYLFNEILTIWTSFDVIHRIGWSIHIGYKPWQRSCIFAILINK